MVDSSWTSIVATMKFAVLAVFLIAGACAQVARYDNYKVYRLIPTSEEQVRLLRQFEEQALDYNIWKGASAINRPVDIMVPPHKSAEFNEFVNKVQFKSEVYVQDVQKLVDESTSNERADEAMDWTSYHRGPVIDAWLRSLPERYPNQVTLVVGGRSYEGRDILGVRVSFREGNRGVFLEGGIHAREWIAPATVTYILNELLTSEDPDVRDIAESYDWYVFPSTNPDGYEYTHSRDRMWRKTRQPHGSCRGADPNRNWGFHWMDGGASSYPCSETYAGSEAFSEPETRSLSQYITSIQSNLVGYLGFHSYSQYLLIPYGHSSAHVENYDELMEIGTEAARSLARRYGTRYEVGNIVEVIYIASGGSMDWVKGNYQTPITYTYELRDTGRYGFLLPPNQIIPTGEETLDSIVTIMQEARARGY